LTQCLSAQGPQGAKSFGQAFSKACRSRAEPWSLPAGSETPQDDYNKSRACAKTREPCRSIIGRQAAVFNSGVLVRMGQLQFSALLAGKRKPRPGLGVAAISPKQPAARQRRWRRAHFGTTGPNPHPSRFNKPLHPPPYRRTFAKSRLRWPFPAKFPLYRQPGVCYNCKQSDVPRPPPGHRRQFPPGSP
jgi:hypothetical protein